MLAKQSCGAVRAALQWVALSLCMVGSASAATIAVTTTTDEFGENLGACGLREAIQAANTRSAFGGCAAGTNGSNTIIVGPGYYVLSRTGANEDANATGDLDISTDMTIGPLAFGHPTPDQIVIAGQGSDRIFDIRNGAHAHFDLMTLSGGDAGNQFGGAAQVTQANADFTDCMLLDNYAAIGGAAEVDGSNSTLAFTRTAIARNRSTFAGGGVYVTRAANVVFSATTIGENLAGAAGGGVFVSGLATSASVTMNNVTIANNEANYANANPTGGGGGIEVGGGMASVHNSVIANNRSHFTGPDCDGTLASFNYNLISRTDNTCIFPQFTAGNLFDKEAHLAPLFDYGNHTLAYHPRYDSPAIGTASQVAIGTPGACAQYDQRGQVKQNNCDMGALQWNMDFVLDRTDDAIDDNPGDGVCHVSTGGCTLRAAIIEANAKPCTAGFCSILLDAQTYTLSLNGQDDSGAAGDLDLLAPVNLFGTLGANSPSGVDAHQIDRVFDIATTAALVDFDIVGGSAPAAGAGGGLSIKQGADVLLSHGQVLGNRASIGGGIYLKQATLHADHCAISNNQTFGGGGGGVFVDDGSGSATFDNCTIGANVAAGDGGGLYMGQSAAELHFTTLAFNNSSAGTVGGIANHAGSIWLWDSIVADNAYTPFGGGAPVPSDCSGIFKLFGGAESIVQTQKYCSFAGSVPLAADPLLVVHSSPVGAFYKLVPASPAYHAVIADDCRTSGVVLETTDQVDAVRAAGFSGPGFCSLGAYDGIEDAIFADGFEQVL